MPDPRSPGPPAAGHTYGSVTTVRTVTATQILGLADYTSETRAP